MLLLLGALISAELVTMVVAAVDAEEECTNPNKVRLVTQEELAMYVPHYTILLRLSYVLTELELTISFCCFSGKREWTDPIFGFLY